MSETFSYKARNNSGKKLSGVLQADSPNRAANILAEQDLIPIEIKAIETLAKPGLFGFMKGKMYESLIIFTRNLSTLYKAGIPILQSLSIIKVGPIDGYFNKAIEKIRDLIRSGTSLSEAIAEFPDIFPEIYKSAISAGELSGKLDSILDSLSFMLEKDMELNRQIKSSVRYPVMVLLAIVAAFGVLITFVIPRFVGFYAKMGSALPAPTKALIWLSEFLGNYWIIVIAAVMAIVFILKKIYSSTSGRLFFDTTFLKIPIFGDLIIKGNIARFSHMLRILIASGIPLVKALETLSGVIKNSRLSSEIRILSESFREGREIANLASNLHFFPDMALQMVKIGTESGALESMLSEVANHYTREVEYKSRHLTALLEPILTVVLGIFVLIVALAIFLPMWNLISAIKG
ncbi:MAG: type II secretion system F family protein [candidate division Zixibacteria bacterium]|nr:type II secretion system F family protein [candidate division Zixibacteria bacterium]